MATIHKLQAGLTRALGMSGSAASWTLIFDRLEFLSSSKGIEVKKFPRRPMAKNHRNNHARLCVEIKEAFARVGIVPVIAGKKTKKSSIFTESSKPQSKFTPTKTKAAIKPTGLTHAEANAESFLSSYEWRRVRMVALKQYGARCQCCGATPATGAVMNVDHIKPRRYFPELALSVDNLQILCSPCNHGKGNWDMTDWRKASQEV